MALFFVFGVGERRETRPPSTAQTAHQEAHDLKRLRPPHVRALRDRCHEHVPCISLAGSLATLAPTLLATLALLSSLRSLARHRVLLRPAAQDGVPGMRRPAAQDARRRVPVGVRPRRGRTPGTRRGPKDLDPPRRGGSDPSKRGPPNSSGREGGGTSKPAASERART